jgi:hypothetical protein
LTALLLGRLPTCRVAPLTTVRRESVSMDGNFAALVDGAARDLGLNDYQLSAAIGLLKGNRVYSPKQVHRLRAGEVVNPGPELVERLVTVLHLDPSEAFAAARVLPHGFKADHFRKLEFFAAHADKVIARYDRWAGQRVPEVRMPAEVAELVRRNRRLQLVA